MRKAKIPGQVVIEKIKESLLRRMDPETRRVELSYKTLMREIGVCRQRIADAVRILKDRGKIVVVEEPHIVDGQTVIYTYYEFHE